MAALKLGLDYFGLGIGLVIQIEGDTYTVKFAVSPDNLIEIGTTFSVEETYCCHTLKAKKGLAFHHAGQSKIATHPCYVNFKLESYIGAPIFVKGNTFGTINFSAAAPRYPFNDEELQFVELLADWLGTELSDRQD